jgi:hypothetical protein
LYCTSVEAAEAEQLDAGGWEWRVDLIYKPTFFDLVGGRSSWKANPCDRPAVWSYDGENYQEYPVQDLDGRAFINGAGDPFNPGPALDVAHSIVTVRKNLSDFNMATQIYWTNGVNNSSVQGVPKGYLRVNKITATMASENGYTYWDAAVTVQYNPRGWWPVKIQNEGCQYWIVNPDNPDEEIKIYATDDNGTQTTDPVLLDADGYRLAKNVVPTPLEFRMNHFVNFGYLLGV